MSKTLIYIALLSEAQPLINLLKLKENQTIQDLPFSNKLFIDEDEKYLLIVSGTGKENCQKSLEYVFQKFTIKRAFNIGAVSCSDSSVKIGTVFCTNRLLANINFAPITTIDTPLESDENLDTLLVDMESKYFQDISKKYCSDIYTFKIVSDYFELERPIESFVSGIVEKSLDKWKKYLF